MAIRTQVNPNTGILEYFDDGLGQAGQFTTIPQNRLDEFKDSFEGGIPTNYAGFAPPPEGQRATVDPATGIRVFTPIPVDPASLSSEDLQRASNIAALENFIDPATGQIRDEFAGGGLPNIDEIRDQDPATFTQTIEALKNRERGRLTGFKGEFTDLSGGDALKAFQGAVGTRAGYVDPYGQKTQIGMQEDIFKDPQSTMVQGTFDEQKYLRDFPDVAEAVRRGDFASGKEHFDAFGQKELRDSYYKGGTVLDLEEIRTKPDEFLDSAQYDLAPTTGQFQAATGTTANIPMPTKTDEQSFTADTSFADVLKEAMVAA